MPFVALQSQVADKNGRLEGRMIGSLAMETFHSKSSQGGVEVHVGMAEWHMNSKAMLDVR